MKKEKKSALQPIRDMMKEGWQMKKMIHQAEYGFFHSTPALYEYRTATTWKQLCDWSNEGFQVPRLDILTLGLAQALLHSVEILSGEELE